MIVELTIAAAGLAVAGAAAELLARLGLARHGRVFVHHPYARRRSELSQDALPDMPPKVRFASNGDGERAGPVPADPEGTLRVLVAGGSAAECFMLDQDTTWPAQLESRLRDDPAIGRPVHVGNVARSLIACRQIDAVLAAALPRFRSLDVIVLMVGASDLVSWLEARTPPEIARGDVDLASYCEDHPFGPFSWTLKGSALYRVARRASARFRGEDPLRKNVGSSLVKHRAMRARATTVLQETPDPAPLLRSFEEDLRALIGTCNRHAPRVVLARQPWLDRDFTPEEEARLWNFGQGSPYRGEVDTYYAIDLVRDLMTRLDEVAARVAAEEAVEEVELRGAVPSDFEHYYDFLHFTPAGAERVAAALAPVIAAGDDGARAGS